MTAEDIAEGLRRLGLDGSSSVIAHASLRSFGYVEGGATAVCRALLAVCGTVLMPAFSDDETAVPAPPGLVRPLNAVLVASSWQEFDEAMARAKPFSKDTPIDREIGVIPETMRREMPCARSAHPRMSFIAAGRHAEELTAAGRLDWCLGPIEALAARDGGVLLLGVGHDKNTAIHLAEQRLGRSRFYRYAKVAPGVWAEFPNIPGCSDGFDDIETLLAGATLEVMIGECRARLIPLADVLAAAEAMILEDPAALLRPAVVDGRCRAALEQRLERLRGEAASRGGPVRRSWADT